MENKGRQKSQGHSKTPGSDEIDHHNGVGFAAASEDTAPQDHVQHDTGQRQIEKHHQHSANTVTAVLRDQAGILLSQH